MVDYDPPPQLAPVEAQVGTAQMANLQGAENSEGTSFGKAFTQMMNLGKYNNTNLWDNGVPAPLNFHVS